MRLFHSITQWIPAFAGMTENRITPGTAFSGLRKSTVSVYNMYNSGYMFFIELK